MGNVTNKMLEHDHIIKELSNLFLKEVSSNKKNTYIEIVIFCYSSINA